MPAVRGLVKASSPVREYLFVALTPYLPNVATIKNESLFWKRFMSNCRLARVLYAVKPHLAPVKSVNWNFISLINRFKLQYKRHSRSETIIRQLLANIQNYKKFIRQHFFKITKMFALKLVLASALVVASARHVSWEDQKYHQGYPLRFDEERRYSAFDEEDPYVEQYGFDHPQYLVRARRQAQGSLTLNSDGGMGLGAKVPLVGNEKNILSAVGSMDLNNQLQPASRGIGLALDNVNGHGFSVMKENVPGFGDKLTGAGKLNVFHNDNHNVDVRAFVTRNMPNFPDVPNFNTVGGGVDYMYKNKVGASLGMANTPFLNRRDYSAMGNLNVFRNPTSSVDFSGGFKRFDTPFMSSGWKPNFGLSFSRSF